MARPGVRGTFSQPGPSHPAAGVRLARTLGFTKYMLTYTAFIDELRTLVPKGRALSGSKGLSNNPEFKRWRHEVSHLIDSIQTLGYAVKCSIQVRRFSIRQTFDAIPERTQRERFERDLTDTLTELEVLIASFDKFGDPNYRPPPPIPAELAKPLTAPEKVTLAWLWQHAPMNLWVALLAGAFSLLSIGIMLGQSALFYEVVSKLQPVSQPASAAQK